MLSGYETSEFYIVRANSRRKRREDDEDSASAACGVSSPAAAERRFELQANSTSSPSSPSSPSASGSAVGHLKLKQTFSVLEAPVGYREYREGVS